MNIQNFDTDIAYAECPTGSALRTLSPSLFVAGYSHNSDGTCETEISHAVDVARSASIIGCGAFRLVFRLAVVPNITRTRDVTRPAAMGPALLIKLSHAVSSTERRYQFKP